MSENPSLFLPESQLTILNIVCALAWADNDLSEEETGVLLETFKTNLPPQPELVYFNELDPLFGSIDISSYTINEQTEIRINAEKAFKDIVDNYKKNPIPLSDLVSQLKTEEDRCLALKLGYMVIKASADDDGNLICSQEKKVYRELIELLDLDSGTIESIENRADRELEKFQHPFKVFVKDVKKFFLQKIEI